MPTISEDALEKGLIRTLQDMNYEYVDVKEENNLQANLKRQLEKHNRKELERHGRTVFTEEEFKHIPIHLEGGTRLRKPRNFATDSHSKLATANIYGWSSLILTNGVRTSFK